MFCTQKDALRPGSPYWYTRRVDGFSSTGTQRGLGHTSQAALAMIQLIGA